MCQERLSLFLSVLNIQPTSCTLGPNVGQLSQRGARGFLEINIKVACAASSNTREYIGRNDILLIIPWCKAAEFVQVCGKLAVLPSWLEQPLPAISSLTRIIQRVCWAAVCVLAIPSNFVSSIYEFSLRLHVRRVNRLSLRFWDQYCVVVRREMFFSLYECNNEISFETIEQQKFINNRR